MSDLEYIQELIDRYFEGLSSLEEEETLREYFRGENIPEEWQIYQPIFHYFDSERNVTPLPRTAHRSPLTAQRLPRPAYLWISAAACVLLFFGVKFISGDKHTNQLSASSMMYINGKKYSDTERIRMETLKVLENVLENRDDAYASQVEALDFFFSND